LTAVAALVLVSTVMSVQHTAAAAPTQYEAENATISQGVVESNHAGFSGTGFVNVDNVVGSYVEFSVNAATAGPASLVFRFANGTTTDRPMDIAVNGTVVAAARSFPGTGAWATWEESTLNTTLTAGANKVRVTSTTANGGPNVDRLQVGPPADTEQPTPPGQPACDEISYDSLTLSWPASDDNVAVVGYDVYFLGQKIAEAPASPFRLTGLRPNTRYQLSVFGRDAAGNVSDSSPEVVCTTTADPGDPAPPSAPGQPSVPAIGQTGATVTWGASTDKPRRDPVRHPYGERDPRLGDRHSARHVEGGDRAGLRHVLHGVRGRRGRGGQRVRPEPGGNVHHECVRRREQPGHPVRGVR
jgi:hypothetical protein